MANRYTIVSAGGWSYAVSGTQTREAAIAEARRSAQAECMTLKHFLALSDDKLAVRVVEGLHRERLVRELNPPESGTRPAKET